MKRLAIIGAGPAGLAAAWKLRDSELEVTVFEKSRGLCGRAASRTRHGVRLDPGANYIKTGSPIIEDLLLRQLPAEELAKIDCDIWIFDSAGKIQPGDPLQNQETKWTYRSGISTLGKLLAAASGVEIRRETRIARIERKGETWNLLDSGGNRLGPFDRLLLTPPAPQTIEILQNSGIAAELIEALKPARYHRQFCFALGFDGERERPGDFHALINTDRKHPIAWLSFENDKPGHVPAGQTVVIVQMQPSWSAEHFEDDINELATFAGVQAIQLLGWDDAKPVWFDSQRWKFAHPYAAANLEKSRSAESDGIFVAGDALIGKGRVNKALETGLEAAGRILASVTA